MRLFSAIVLSSMLAAAAVAATKPTSTANDDSCDISLLPAATLLLPYFEVDFNTPQTVAQTTLFTIQNTTATPQIARVTLWTDWAYPMLTFNIFLTGYDVQIINLYDIFSRATIAPGPSGTGGGTSSNTPPGEISLAQNPRFLPETAGTSCRNLPGVFALSLLAEMKSAFTKGTITTSGCAVKAVGGVHANAVGYATIDVVANCDTQSPLGPAYFAELLFDNVLTGDYEHISPNPATGNYAGGNPLVHIRAVPEGGVAGQVIPTNLPYTFYDMVNNGPVRSQDRRQPLPSAFMPRFIDDKRQAYETKFQIWREASVAPVACPIGLNGNAAVPYAETVRFDEHENPTVYQVTTGLPLTSSVSSSNTTLLPPLSTSGDAGGWLYLNLDNGGRRPNQAWVVTSMFGEGRYSVAMDAVAVGNGCSPAPAPSSRAAIGPAANSVAEVSAATKPTTIDNDDSCDISLLPAATLLLPYFEVDFNLPATTARTTIFTIQNTTATPQIARVTLWTDWSYPMLTFNVYLTGYGIQGINLWDLFVRGVMVPGSGAASRTGERSLAQNPHFLPDAVPTCSNPPGRLDGTLIEDLRKAFTTGQVAAPGCKTVKKAGSNNHGPNAVGYATIDVVANCDSQSPVGPTYFGQILFDNVLTGDYQLINPNPATGNYAGGSPLVHIRAVPEGGVAGEFVPTNLPYTFYDLYTRGMAMRTQDRRQPLPSAFLPPFINGGTGAFNTSLVIWREAYAAPTACPTAYDQNSNWPIAEAVRFDEHENPTIAYSNPVGISMYYGPIGLPSLTLMSAANSNYLPPLSTSGDVGGWLYLNLNNGGSAAYSSARNYRFGTTRNGPRQSQAWVVTTMAAEGRYAVAMDAAAAGNGCSHAPEAARYVGIGPSP